MQEKTNDTKNTKVKPTKVKKKNPIVSFVKETRSELGKIVWPTRKQTINYTIIVCVGIVIAGIFLSAFDYGFTSLFNYLIKLMTV